MVERLGSKLRNHLLSDHESLRVTEARPRESMSENLLEIRNPSFHALERR